METEQAHSGRAVYPKEQMPLVWLNLVCLDAPLVSVVWLCLFAKTFHVTVDAMTYAALFITAWSIYLADRLADSYSLPPEGARSLRHAFCLRHRSIWLVALVVIGAGDAIVIWRNIGVETLLAGSVVGTFALLHLVLNHSLAGAWPPLPLKEFVVGSLFAAGTLVPLFPVLRPITDSMLPATIAFAALCTLNCISIAYWERELDEIQHKVSFATRFPGLGRHMGKICIVLTLGSAVALVPYRQAAPIFGCVGVSALLLGVVDSFGERIVRDRRTALADLVLLTPLPALLMMKV